MSDRDFMNLDDDLLDSGASDRGGDWDADLLGDFPDDDPAAEDTTVPVAAPAHKASPEPAAAKAAKAPRRPRSARRRAGGGGALCFLLVLLAGLTLGTGLLTATGATPESLLDFSGFTDPLTIGDFRSHPINAFWLAAAVTLVAATLAAVAVERRVKGLAGSAEADALKLAAVMRLDPDQPETFQQEELQDDPELASVVSNLFGHYNLQQAKLMRYVDLEGELHRLEKAVADASLGQLSGNWENPAAGSLADQIVRVLSASQEAGLQSGQRLKTLEQEGPDLVTGLRDARSWNAATLDQLNHQLASADRLARHLGKLVEQAPADDQRNRQLDRLRQALQAVQDELANLPARGAERRRDPGAPLTTLVERASRLAFQIAMEVARLGAKGERLLPLTQDLEELTTELRRGADTPGKDGQDDPRERALDAVRGRLAELDPSVLADLGASSMASVVQQAAPLAGQTAASLSQLARGFNVQTARLSQLLNVAGDLTGLDTGGEGDPEAGPGAGLAVDQFDPFGSERLPETGLVADPFASSGGSIFDAATQAGFGGEFSQVVLPGQDDAHASATATPDLAPAAVPEPAATAAPGAAVTGVPAEAEKIYDLSEFAAQRLPAEASAAAEEQVYDLSEFDAVKIS
ncbi:MAG: hypothetical protein R3D98_03770 [Candidatus Krumholzibacteriia bacterium]